RRRHTRLQGDWSSDVCSSDLTTNASAWWQRLAPGSPPEATRSGALGLDRRPKPLAHPIRTRPNDEEICKHAAREARRAVEQLGRSEERRVGKEWRSRWSLYA